MCRIGARYAELLIARTSWRNTAGVEREDLSEADVVA
jgi:hypothetical protein